MGGETRSVLGTGIATATATGAAPVVVPDPLVYLDPTGPRRTTDGPREGIAGAVKKAEVHVEGVFRGRLGRRNLR